MRFSRFVGANPKGDAKRDEHILATAESLYNINLRYTVNPTLILKEFLSNAFADFTMVKNTDEESEYKHLGDTINVNKKTREVFTEFTSDCGLMGSNLRYRFNRLLADGSIQVM